MRIVWQEHASSLLHLSPTTPPPPTSISSTSASASLIRLHLRLFSSPLCSSSNSASLLHLRLHPHLSPPPPHIFYVSLLLPSTINLITVAVNHRRTQRRCCQPSTNPSQSPSTIVALIAVAGNHRRTHRRCRQPSTHSSPAPQPSTHSLPSLSTINTLIAVTINHQSTHRSCWQPLTQSPSTIAVVACVSLDSPQPLTHSLLSASTINTFIAVAINHPITVNHQHTHCRHHQPSTHSSQLPATINAVAIDHRHRCVRFFGFAATIDTLIAVAVNHQHIHRRRHQPSTHSSPSPSTINTLISVAVNHQRTHCRCRKQSTLSLGPAGRGRSQFVIKFTYII